MLTLTEGALQAIHGLVGDRPGAGLRLSSRESISDNDRVRLDLSISDAPEATDEVVEQGGCQVFLAEQVAPLVDGRTLDAHPAGDNRVEFVFLS
jgi:Fe-S cluster assembly iron-binding protein IscA